MDTSQAAVDSKQGDATTNEHTPAAANEGTEQQEVTEATKTNGEAGSTAPAAPASEADDVDMKDAGEAPGATESGSSPAVAPTNGTPAISKKAKNGSSKKKGSIIPEHKSKKLNKKKSKPLTNLDAQPGEYYFARMKGHPPWPSIVCDEEMLPQSLLDTRPVTTKLPDGTYKKPEYADGGKRAYERTFPIMFLHTNEFAWMPNTELTPLDVESVTDAPEKGKSKLLLAAYEKAAEQNDLDYFKEMLVDHQKAIQEDQEAQAQREAKKASKAKRKSQDAAAQTAAVEEMEVDEEVPEPKPKSKKRKKDLDSDAGDEKPAKTPKTATKLKLSTPKTPAAEPASKKKATKPKAKPTPKPASDDEAVDTPKIEQTPLTPAAAKEIKEKKVLYYRHKLQRGFLSRDTMPKEDEMKSMSDFLSELEVFPDLEGSIIRATKIHKVLKAMIKLPSIPLDEDYQFKTRSIDLLAKWNDILSNDPNAGTAGDKGDDAKPETTATTNGTSKATKQQALKAEAGEAIAPEEESKGALENKIGTTVEGEKEAEKDSASTVDKESLKDTEPEKPAEDDKSDEPDVDSAPAEDYKPAADAAETSA